MSLSQLLPKKGPLLNVESAFQIFQNKKLAGFEKVRFLDCTWTLGTFEQAKQLYQAEHIPQAKWFEIDSICQQNTDLPHMFPETSLFVEWMKKLKITNDNVLIVYDRIPFPSAARVWWTFKTFGHHNVYIMNGGLHQWKERSYPTVKSSEEKSESEEKEVGEFRVSLKKEKIYSFEDVQKRFVNIEKVDSLLIDARPANRFEGTVPEPRPGLRSGHIPGAINIPFGQVYDPQTGLYHANPQVLEKIKEKFGGETKQKEMVLYCGSGITACALQVGLSLVGITNSYDSGDDSAAQHPPNPETDFRISIYDGSWTEYATKTQE